MNKSAPHKKNYTIGIAAGIVALALIVVVAIGTNQDKSAGSATSSGAGTLTAAAPSFDFGRISMAAGKVSRDITIKNTGTASVTATRLTTSCMCTTAELIYQGKSEGPFGMPGHGFIPGIKTAILPGDEATIKVVFDPAAHGPAGVGAIRREIYLEQEGGKRLTVNFSAFVTP